MTADQKEELQLGSKTHAELDRTSLDDCHRSVLNIIAERSPCPEPKLFITAINSGLECFRGMPLGDLRELLGQCVQDLKAGGLVEIVEDEFVLADTAGAEDEETLDQTADLELRPRKLDGESSAQGHTEEPPTSGRAHSAVTDDAGDADEPPTEESGTAPPVSVEDADILDLSGALELAREELDEIPIDQDHDAEAKPSSDTLQANSEVTDDAEDGQESPADDIGASSPESAEDTDVFDLTDALELVPEEPEETTINEDHVEEEPQAGSTTTDGRKDAAEPTREEIVAALRRFVSDGETENSK